MIFASGIKNDEFSTDSLRQNTLAYMKMHN